MENNEKKHSTEDIAKILDNLELESADTPHEQPDPSLKGFVFENPSSDGDEGGAPADDTADVSASEDSSLDTVDDGGDAAGEDSSPASKVWRTYVPRFTDASEKYRLRGDDRLRALKEERERGGKSDDVGKSGNDGIDPTAEIEDTELKAKTPERTSREESVESIKIFKFSGESSEDDIEEINGRTVEDERRELEELLGTAKKEEAKEPDAADEPELEDGASEDESDSSDGFVMSDPDDGDISVYDSPVFREEDDGIEESPVEETLNRKGKIKESEFTNPVQRDTFKDRFLDSILSIRIRLLFAALFAVVLFVTEMLAISGAIKPTLFAGSTTNYALALVDLLLAASIFVLTAPETVSAVKNLFSKKILAEILPAASFVVLVGYTLVVIFADLTSYALLGFLFAVMAIPVIVASLYRAKANFISFKMISQPEEKQFLDKKNTRDLPPENMALDGVIDEYKSKIARTFRASFISNFFKKTASVGFVNRNVGIILAVVASISLICGIVAYFISGLGVAISVFAAVFMLGCPTFSVLTAKVPFFHVQRAAIMEESIAVGDAAYHNFSSVDVVAFEDSEIFGPDDVNLRRFMLYGDRGNMENVMRQMCALFAVVGGPLDFLFSNAIDNRVRHKAATNPIIEDDGLCGMVMGHKIYAGSEDYMRRNGIPIPDAALSSSTDVGIDTTKIMYAAEDGVVSAKFYIRYSFSEEFTMILPALREEKIVPLVYTRDPNISNELLETLTAGCGSMRVVRQYVPIPKEERVYSRVSADIITYGDKINAINMILLSKKYKRFSEYMGFAETCAAAIGMVFALVLAIIGLKGAALIVASLWHVVWCVALRVISKNVFLKEKRKKNDE